MPSRRDLAWFCWFIFAVTAVAFTYEQSPRCVESRAVLR